MGDPHLHSKATIQHPLPLLLLCSLVFHMTWTAHIDRIFIRHRKAVRLRHRKLAVSTSSQPLLPIHFQQ
jgi:hypothetical protein